MVPIFSPRRRLYEALYEPEAIIPLFHYSNCERSELSSIFLCVLKKNYEMDRSENCF